MTTELKTDSALSIVKENTMRAANEAFDVLASLRGGAISLNEASEMSNAIGKVNGANANTIKCELLSLAIDKQQHQCGKIEME